MEKVTIKKLNEVYIKVVCEPSIAMELSQYFTFKVPGYQFMPAYKNKMWSGDIKLYNVMTNTIHSGLLRYIEEFCKSRKYEINYESDFSSTEFSLAEAEEFVRSLNLKITPRDYQMEAFVHAICERRTLLLSPTASGKSLNIYLLARYLNKKTLIIVPTTTLVHQLYSDFQDYGYDSNKYVHKIYAGQDKVTNKPVTISTWQSLHKMPKEFFDQFDVVIGDEAHNFKAKSLTSIMDKMVNCKYRFGFTGTIDGSQTNKLVQEIGPFTRGREVGVVIENDIRRLILEGREARLRQIAVGITLELLFAQFKERIEVMRHNDQVGLVRATVQRQPEGVHVGFHGHSVCSRRRSGEVGPRHFAELVAPEGPRCGVDAPDRALTVGLDQVRQTVDLVGQRAVRVDVNREVVGSGTESVFLARLDEVNHLLLAGVHAEFPTGRSDVQRDLLVGILDRGQHVGRARVQGFITDVTLIGRVLRVVDGFGNFITAGNRFDVALPLHAVEEGVVDAHLS